MNTDKTNESEHGLIQKIIPNTSAFFFKICVYLCPIIIFCGAVNYVEFRAATNPTWFVAEREGFEPSVPLLAEHTISSRAPSASSVISPQLQKFKLVGNR